jgi:hypothetical protein
MQPKSPKSLFVTMVITWLIAGTLDGLAALFILAKGNTIVFKYVASAVFGKAAFDGGTRMIFAGIAFHYIVAAGVTLFYFILYNYLPLIRKNIWLTAVGYGIFIWFVMNVCVVALTRAHPAPLSLQRAIINIVILIVCVALPIVYMRYRYAHKTNNLQYNI